MADLIACMNHTKYVMANAFKPKNQSEISFFLISLNNFIHLFIHLKLVGFIMSLTSFIFILYAENIYKRQYLVGNMLCIISAIGSAILQVLWSNGAKVMTNNQRTLLISLIGLCNILVGWLLLLVFHFTGVESLSFLRTPIESFKANSHTFYCFLYAGILGISKEILKNYERVEHNFLENLNLKP